MTDFERWLKNTGIKVGDRVKCIAAATEHGIWADYMGAGDEGTVDRLDHTDDTVRLVRADLASGEPTPYGVWYPFYVLIKI